MMKKQIESIKDKVSPHTIKKIELIEKYVEDWSHKLLNYPKCKGVIFIDCMCNSGVYLDDKGNEIVGTPVRVAKYLSNIMEKHLDKHAILYFNDLYIEKIEELKNHLPQNTDNFEIMTSTGDANDILKDIATNLSDKKEFHCLLVYDPYTASIDWDALNPFLNNWGEVIINHMVSDTIRGVSQAKNPATISKYEKTYRTSFEELIFFENDRNTYEKRIQEIIKELHRNKNKKYFIASFPFFNTRNVVIYNLIHGSSNIEGFKLFKKTAWKIFGGKSSSKDTYGIENQLIIDTNKNDKLTTVTDEYCYYVNDIAKYLYDKFENREDVRLEEVWGALDDHPVFPSEGYRPKIKNELRDVYNCKLKKDSIIFGNGGNQHENG